MTSEKASYTYLPALDGLRAIAVVLVMLSHVGLEHVIPGIFGVIIFFVISGFLITRQMIAEIEAKGTLNIRIFYLRRFFRLAPALVVYVAAFTTILIALGAVITLPQILSGLFYYANYYLIFIGYGAHSPMPVLWSLAVEEHFYLIFPFCMLAFRNNLRSSIVWLCAAMAVALAWRIAMNQICQNAQHILCSLPDKERFFGTDTIFDCILYGALAALLLSYKNAFTHRWLINTKACLIAVGLLAVSLLYRDDFFRQTLRLSLEAGASAILILNILYGKWPRIAALLSTRAMLFTGRISYGLYLFHYGALVVIGRIFYPDGFFPASSLEYGFYICGVLGSAFVLATASYYFIEKPMLKIRKRFGAHGITKGAFPA
jgi:peptidoglycan/LPS O-acetylase OafA/YrhL